MGEIFEILDNEQEAIFLQKGMEFGRSMTYYRCAIMEIETKLNVLNQEFSMTYDRNPIETIKTRLKSPLSIVEKLKRKGLEVSQETMDQNLSDIAGIRVVCSFKEDIYRLADLLIQQDDIVLVEKKDYIVNPKPNGYQSLHLILEIPVFLSTGPKKMKVEVQFRTIAMDFWASLDHKLHYKKEYKNQQAVEERLKKCAEIISALDDEMQDIRSDIDQG